MKKKYKMGPKEFVIDTNVHTILKFEDGYWSTSVAIQKSLGQWGFVDEVKHKDYNKALTDFDSRTDFFNRLAIILG